jgi:hypothetical protein
MDFLYKIRYNFVSGLFSVDWSPDLADTGFSSSAIRTCRMGMTRVASAGWACGIPLNQDAVGTSDIAFNGWKHKKTPGI